jgi:mercuric ion transport protein
MKSSSLTFASIIAAITASLCCIGPTLAVLLGVGAFGLASVFESARPYLLAVADVLIVTAFYQAYRSTKADEACIAGACPVPRRPQRALLWIGLVIVILFAAYPYYSEFLWPYQESVQSSSNSTMPSMSSHYVRLASLHIDGMFCGGCAAAVQSALSHVDGVRHVSVDLEKKTATVDCDPSRARVDRMEAAVAATGYKATLIDSTVE